MAAPNTSGGITSSVDNSNEKIASRNELKNPKNSVCP